MNPETQEPMTHIFLKPCGCLACAIVDKPEMLPEIGRAFRYSLKHGETYQKVPTQQVREMDWKCKDHKKTDKTEVKLNESERST